MDVAPEYRQLGVGSKLLSEIEKIFKEKGAEKCRLEVRKDNKAALRLYEKFGYRKIGELRRFYGVADGVLLEKNLR